MCLSWLKLRAKYLQTFLNLLGIPTTQEKGQRQITIEIKAILIPVELYSFFCHERFWKIRLFLICLYFLQLSYSMLKTIGLEQSFYVILSMQFRHASIEVFLSVVWSKRYLNVTVT